MHETGLIRNLLETAMATARSHGSELRAVTLRLGALAGGSANHLRSHFEVEIANRNLGDIGLDIIEDPDYLGGVEIVSVDLAEPRHD
ncbi:hydrogenase maturation nickel metallochaperone HypA [Pseudomaricurvus alkylphenolicus]|uniref:hydrogenase maturation nickel metallochaperone HypA n=1 Tax=Pseudomaricurvus alkylphenolicus TaxID=1306991 RepID=UPI00142062FB|nr:hydrogenase maturation nickel metallochaperone HypA [Pseudomaricurvus alkylphenolicus]NIB45017.1 hydrogenase maturation nickel metallochaperone HypA [Pseudomaricurvus alkylphenolicus]